MQPFLASHQLPAFAAAVPALDTERLTLRGFRREDFEDSCALWGDPRVTRYITGRPQTREECWGRLLRHLGHWAALGFGYWVVRERASGRFIGEVGMIDLMRDISPSFDGAPEAGWILSPERQGQGFATEAVSAILGWSEQVLGAPRVVCIIDPAHQASIKVAQRCGFTRFAIGTYHDSPVHMFERFAAPR